MEKVSNIYNMLPYIVTMIVLIFTSRKSRAPKAEGIPYDQGPALTVRFPPFFRKKG